MISELYTDELTSEYISPGKVFDDFWVWYETDDYCRKFYARQKALRAMFESYRSATGEDRKLMDYLLKTHATLCKQQGKPDAMRKHNTFVLRYVAGAGVKEVAVHSHVSKSTVFADILWVLDNMMLLAFGVEDLIPYEYIPVLSPEEYEGRAPEGHH